MISCLGQITSYQVAGVCKNKKKNTSSWSVQVAQICLQVKMYLNISLNCCFLATGSFYNKRETCHLGQFTNISFKESAKKLSKTAAVPQYHFQAVKGTKKRHNKSCFRFHQKLKLIEVLVITSRKTSVFSHGC